MSHIARVRSELLTLEADHSTWSAAHNATLTGCCCKHWSVDALLAMYVGAAALVKAAAEELRSRGPGGALTAAEVKAVTDYARLGRTRTVRGPDLVELPDRKMKSQQALAALDALFLEQIDIQVLLHGIKICENGGATLRKSSEE